LTLRKKFDKITVIERKMQYSLYFRSNWLCSNPSEVRL